jgi:hypothetical protein
VPLGELPPLPLPLDLSETPVHLELPTLVVTIKLTAPPVPLELPTLRVPLEELIAYLLTLETLLEMPLTGAGGAARVAIAAGASHTFGAAGGVARAVGTSGSVRSVGAVGDIYIYIYIYTCIYIYILGALGKYTFLNCTEEKLIFSPTHGD